MQQTVLRWTLGDAPKLQALGNHLPSYPCYAEVSNRFLWDNGNLPYALSGVVYEPIGVLEMKKSNRFKSNIEFVTLKLTSQDKTKFEEWAKPNAGKIFKYLGELAEGGYKFSVSPDFNNACVIASLTGTDNSVDNGGLCMTSRAETIDEALLVMCYKHFVMANGGNWLDIAGQNSDNWG